MADEILFDIINYMFDKEDKYPIIKNNNGCVEVNEERLKLTKEIFLYTTKIAELYNWYLFSGRLILLPALPTMDAEDMPVDNDTDLPFPSSEERLKEISENQDKPGLPSNFSPELIIQYPKRINALRFSKKAGYYPYVSNSGELNFTNTNQNLPMEYWVRWYKWYKKCKEIGVPYTYKDIANFTGRSLQTIKNKFNIVKGEIED